MSPISIELVPRSRESLDADLARLSLHFPELRTVNIPDLLRFDLRSWEACAAARRVVDRAIPHLRAMDVPTRAAAELANPASRWTREMRRFAPFLLCALLAACRAEEEPPAPTPYEFELAAHDESTRALEARARQGLERLPQLSRIAADAPSALAFEVADPDFFVRTCRGPVMRECGLLAMRLLQPYVEAVRQGLPFDDEVVELTAGLVEGYTRNAAAFAEDPKSADTAEALREVTERFVLEALGWVGSDELDEAHQQDLVTRIRSVLDEARATGHDPLTPASCPRLRAVAAAAPDEALRVELAELAAGTGCDERGANS